MNRILPIFWLLGTALLLTACEPSEDQIHAAAVQLLTEQAAASPAPVNLEEIALIDGDLPAGYELGSILAEAPRINELPEVVDFYGRNALKDNYVAEIHIYIFQDEASALSAYGVLSSGITEPADFGENGKISSESSVLFPVIFSNAVFKRCNAVALIVLPSAEDAIRNYAIRLDERLTNAYC